MIFFEGVSKHFQDGLSAVSNLSLNIEKGETLALLGRSGSGKTTIMKMINRLVEPSSGNVWVDGQDIMTTSPIDLRRKIGYSIQSIGLFPHLTVCENIGLAPKLQGWNVADIEERVDHLLALIGLEEVKMRYPHELSGGQKQRVGVARALGADPPIILMDEPFGALDPITRRELQEECQQLFSDLGKTVVFVTHDVFEAVLMGDRVALLDQGSLIQLSSPEELIENPHNEIAYQFIEHHRFQLSLLTQTLKKRLKLLQTKPQQDLGYKLTTRDSLIEALDLFKQTGQNSLPVFSGKNYYGILRKDVLLDEIIDLLMREKQEVAC